MQYLNCSSSRIFTPGFNFKLSSTSACHFSILRRKCRFGMWQICTRFLLLLCNQIWNFSIIWLCPQFTVYILCFLDVYVTVFSVSSSSWAFLVRSILTSQLLRIHCLFCYIALSCGHVFCFLLWQPSTLSRILGSASFAAFEQSWFITCCLDNYLKIGC